MLGVKSLEAIACCGSEIYFETFPDVSLDGSVFSFSLLINPSCIIFTYRMTFSTLLTIFDVIFYSGNNKSADAMLT